MTNMLAGSLMPLLTIKRLIAIRCWGATLTFFLAKTLRLLVEPCLLPSSQSIFSVYFPSMARNQSETKTWNQFKKPAAKTHISYFLSHLLHCHQNLGTEWIWKKWEWGGAQMHCSYLIFVIFFTRAKFLDTKIYTKKRQIFALNL